jgi:predicted kinase
MAKLIVTRGLPASGKSTKAVDYTRAHLTNTVRVNRDLLREMLHGSVFVGGKNGTEPTIRSARNKLIAANLIKGRDVVVDDTNLESKTMRELHTLAWIHGAELATWDLCHVPLLECISRDLKRAQSGGRHVGDVVIRSMAQRAKLDPAGGTAPLWVPEAPETPIEKYEPLSGKPNAYIVDIDGTVALHVARSPYDYTRVEFDGPNPAVISLLNVLRTGPMAPQIIFLSGRPDSCRDATEKWLDQHVQHWDELYMRAAGDTRNDAIIKYELFSWHVRNRFNVKGVLDDRDRVVRLWRALGLSVFQVNDGDF